MMNKLHFVIAVAAAAFLLATPVVGWSWPWSGQAADEEGVTTTWAGPFSADEGQGVTPLAGKSLFPLSALKESDKNSTRVLGGKKKDKGKKNDKSADDSSSDNKRGDGSSDNDKSGDSSDNDRESDPHSPLRKKDCDGKCNPDCQTCVKGKCTNRPEGFRCDDGDSCTANDYCWGGMCKSGKKIAGCGQQCFRKKDGEKCLGDDRCFVEFSCWNGQCEGTKEKECPVCYSCDEGKCEKDPAGTSCNDPTDLCTEPNTGKCNGGGKCIGKKVNCDSPCQTCDPKKGCVVNPSKIGKRCNDDSKCTKQGTSTCSDDGICGGGEAKECDDCEYCDPIRGCVADPAKTYKPCDDGNACTLSATCAVDGKCRQKEKRECGQCQRCDPFDGCVANTKFDGFSCEDDDKCKTGSECWDGVCSGGKPKCQPNEKCDPKSGICIPPIETGRPTASPTKSPTDRKSVV